MKHSAKSIRSFIGAQNFEQSRNFYTDLGFTESILSDSFSFFSIDEKLGFYLQDYYLKDWIDNSMLFLEVNNVEEHWNYVQGLDLTSKYKTVKLVPIKVNDWGWEYFLHDPSGILWHFGEFLPHKGL